MLAWLESGGIVAAMDRANGQTRTYLRSDLGFSVMVGRVRQLRVGNFQ